MLWEKCVVQCVWVNILRQINFVLCFQDAFGMVPVLLQPRSRGRISLKSSNPYHWPRMEPNFYTERSDLTTLIEGIRIVNLTYIYVVYKY